MSAKVALIQVASSVAFYLIAPTFGKTFLAIRFFFVVLKI